MTGTPDRRKYLGVTTQGDSVALVATSKVLVAGWWSLDRVNRDCSGRDCG
jgi:hypothetical protein